MTSSAAPAVTAKKISLFSNRLSKMNAFTWRHTLSFLPLEDAMKLAQVSTQYKNVDRLHHYYRDNLVEKSSDPKSTFLQCPELRKLKVYQDMAWLRYAFGKGLAALAPQLSPRYQFEMARQPFTPSSLLPLLFVGKLVLEHLSLHRFHASFILFVQRSSPELYRYLSGNSVTYLSITDKSNFRLLSSPHVLEAVQQGFLDVAALEQPPGISHLV